MKTILRMLLPCFFMIFTLMACWEFLSIEQPELADPNSTFNVPITVALTPEDSSSEGYNSSDRRGYFGIRLPIGWTVQDSIHYQGIINGIFVYSEAHSDSMEKYESSPDGYYWWVSVCDSVDSLLEGNISFTPQITTDSQTGNFSIDYIISDRIEGYCSCHDTYVVHSGPHGISVDAPMEVAVTNTNDSGEGSLRQAILDVSNHGEIVFDLSYPDTIVLDSQLVINRRVSITGPESNMLTISGNKSDRVFLINDNAKVMISNLILCDGYKEEESGGGIFGSRNSKFSLDNIIIVNCSASNGGAIGGFTCSFDLNNVVIINNSAHSDDGGGIGVKNSEFNLSNVIISNNMAADNGGGIEFLGGGVINLENVTINNNTAKRGGGIWFDGLSLNFDSEKRCNIYQNTAEEGNDLLNASDSIFHVILDTFTVMIPTDLHAQPIDKFRFDIQNAIVTDISMESLDIPYTFSLSQNYPNPFNPSTNLTFTLPTAETVNLQVYNTLGQEVSTLVEDRLEAGSHEVRFNASNLPSGVYFYRLQAGSYVDTKKMLLIK